MKALSIIIAFQLLSPICFAEDSKKKDDWFFRFGIGPVMGTQSDYTLEVNGSAVNTQKKVLDGDSTAINFESAYLPPGSFFGFSLLTELNPYKYKSGGSDSELGFYAVPKLRLPLGFFELWGGAAVGVLLTKIASDSGVMDGLLLTFAESQNATFAVQPRVGFDFNFGQSFKLGFFAAYCKTSGTASGSAIRLSDGASVPLKVKIENREWVTGGVSMGIKF